MTERSGVQLAQVRRLLARLAAPHAVMRLISADVDAHVAALQPTLALLEAAPFTGLSAGGVIDELAAPVARAGRAAGPVLMPARASSARPGEAVGSGKRTGSGLKDDGTRSGVGAEPRLAPAPVGPTTRPVSSSPLQPATARTQGHAPLDSANAAAPDAAFATPGQPVVHNDSAAHSSIERAVDADGEDVDFNALVQRVLRRRRRHHHTEPERRTVPPLPEWRTATASDSAARTYDVAIKPATA
ncbi:MAG TPA: hypothetical protein VF021_05460, partial [Longimicrobiales bacterium]